MLKSTLKCNPSKPGKALKRTWEFGFNTCHGALTMRKDLSATMQDAHDRLGMRHWRCHGLLDDENGVWSRRWIPEDPSKEVYGVTFSGLRRILDNAIEMGLTPFMELSHMPQMLALYDDAYMFHYRANTSPPKDPAQWGDLIEEVLRRCVKRYGLHRVRQWWFEVWNEPNLGPLFDEVEAAPGPDAERTGSKRPAAFFHGSQLDYLNMYREAARGVKSVDSELRIGGPSTAKTAWVTSFLEACLKDNMPVDFLSTHRYATCNSFEAPEFANMSREEKSRQPRWAGGMDEVWEAVESVRKQIDALIPDLPLIWSEWNIAVAWPWHQREECNNAAHVFGACAAYERWCQGQLFWNLSDIWEEPDLHFEPFSGQMGMYTVDGIPKASARAFELLHGLETCELPLTGLPENPQHGAIGAVSPNGKSVTIALWNLHEHRKEDRDWEVEFDFGDSKARHVSVRRILPRQGSAFEVWQDMGEPRDCDEEQFKALWNASEPILEDVDVSKPVGVPAGSVALVEIALQ